MNRSHKAFDAAVWPLLTIVVLSMTMGLIGYTASPKSKSKSKSKPRYRVPKQVEFPPEPVASLASLLPHTNAVPHAGPAQPPPTNSPPPIRYPLNINPDDYFWNVQYSRDMVHWQDMWPSNSYGVSGIIELPQIFKPVGFYRLKGKHK